MEGIVYKIVCNETGECYIGSTIQTIDKRMAKHCSNHNNTASKNIINRGNYSVHILEEADVENKTQLRILENEYIKNNECVNKKAAYITPEEKKEYMKNYRLSHKDELREYMHKYQKQHHVKVYAKNYYYNYYKSLPVTLCECGGQYKSISNKNKHFKTKKHVGYIDSLSLESEDDVVENDFDTVENK